MAMPWLIVVARGQPVLYNYFRRDHFGDEGITVVLDRRTVAERRWRNESHRPDRRRAERRQRDISEELLTQGWAEVLLPED